MNTSLPKDQDIPPKGDKRRSPLKMIRQSCLDCSGGSEVIVRECVMTHCPLYAFRFGTNPYNKRSGSKNKKQTNKVDE